MKAHIAFVLFAVHYNLVIVRQYLARKRDNVCSRYHRWAAHFTFLSVNLFFLATYDTVKEYVLPFGLIGLGITLLISKADW